MNYHKRWLCKECKREWHDVYQTNANGGNYVNSYPESVTGNPPGENCPICGSPEIVEIAYKPRAPGLDIPRNGEYIELPKRRTIATIPGLTGVNDLQIHSSSKEIILRPEIPETKGIQNPPTIIQDIIRSEEVQIKSTLPTGPGNSITLDMAKKFAESDPYDLSDMD